MKPSVTAQLPTPFDSCMFQIPPTSEACENNCFLFGNTLDLDKKGLLRESKLTRENLCLPLSCSLLGKTGACGESLLGYWVECT